MGSCGLVTVGASADFRNSGNPDRIGTAGGEEPALAAGRGRSGLTGAAGRLLADLVVAAFAEA
ncbi:hypothetical protein [Streptomyces wuyuanensis]|uniref:hypothetical protein n=1 Tax=Streptomyces wuyuanensis TaxID=1196353 RepID=UPI003F53E938